MKALELSYINGDGHIDIPSISAVHWSDESQLDLDIVLEEIAKRPAKITNDKEADIYREKLGKVREAEVEITKTVQTAKNPLSKLVSLIVGCGKADLDKLAEEATFLKNELDRWVTLKKIGAMRLKSDKLDKAKEQERKAQTAVTKKERQIATKRAEELMKQAVEEAKEKHSVHGVAQVEKWVGEMINPALYFKEAGARHAEFATLTLNANAINAHCKEIIKNGGTITSKTIPGIALRKETYSQYRG